MSLLAPEEKAFDLSECSSEKQNLIAHRSTLTPSILKMLTIITPFYSRDSESYLPARARFFIENCCTAPWAERIFVDQGSPDFIAKPLKSLCAERGIKYISLNMGGVPFSAGKCRNAGARNALGEFLLFEDVDLIGDDGLYEALREKLTSRDIEFNYLEMIPCFYLTEAASKEYEEMDEGLRSGFVYDAYLSLDRNKIKNVAPATSCLLLRRHFYLAEGGVREEFFGHGYEDFELTHRLAARARKFYRSHNYYSHDYKYDSFEYKGYRTFFSLFGRQNLAEKNFLVHLHHEPARDYGYKESSSRNKALFEGFAKKYDESFDGPPALDDANAKITTLCLGSRIGLPFKGLRQVIPFLGKIVYREEKDFKDRDDFFCFVEDNDISRVFFLTPYGNEDRLEVYQWCRDKKFPMIVFDRGALPDSWFFDSNGFNADSASYASENWDHSLPDQRMSEVEKYIQQLCSSDATLEENGARKGDYEFRRRFELIDKKVIFAPLQRPNDSVIKNFSGAVAGVNEFCGKLAALSKLLPRDWRIIVKQHPLESEKIEIPGVIVLPNDVHVYDAILASDAVVLINSGVGLLSLCFGKPVYCFGKSFYTHKGLAEKVNDEYELLNLLLADPKVDFERVRRFVSYLVFDFYSFAKTTYKKVVDRKGFRNVAVHMDFYALNIPPEARIRFDFRMDPIPSGSPLYDFYRSYFFQQQGQKKITEIAPVKALVKKEVGKSEVKPAGQEKTLPTTLPVRKVATPAPSLNEGSIRKNISEGRGKGVRKFKKFLRSPGLFFRDAIKNSSNS